jgi:hypothetical protein
LSGSSAAAFSTFGTYQTTLEHTGSRVGIPAPDSGQFVPGDEWIVHRAAVQSGFNSAAGLIQSGLIRQGGGLGLDGCGTGNGLTYRYLEIKEYGSPIYNCNIFYGLGNVPSGQTITFDIFRRAATSTWGLWINGVDRGTFNLGFNTGVTQAGGEIASADALFATETSTTYGSCCMGWSYYTGVNRVGAVLVNGGVQLAGNSSSLWHLSPVPTPFYVKHRL